MDDVLLSNYHKHDMVDRCALVIFGASGDLSRRKLLPAIYNLAKTNKLPRNFALVGTSRSIKSVEDLRTLFQQAVEEHSRTPLDPEVWGRIADVTHHLTGDPHEAETYSDLQAYLARLEESADTGGNHLFYLSTPPSTFLDIIKNLDDSGLLTERQDTHDGRWPRVLVEKPFGLDLSSAQRLNQELGNALSEDQIFRIDHYLGKETVQNILVFRFSNTIFEPIWNRKYIDHVQITASEDAGVGTRGAFYDETGVLRDVVQNHLLQVLALCAIEPPAKYAAEAIRDEKAKVFGSLRPLDGPDLAHRAVLGQYKGYRDEPKVAPDSQTPTYAALEVMIDNWRWQGVPFYLRAGKKMARRMTEVAIHFQPIPYCFFGGRDICQAIEPNVLLIRIQPDEGISLRFATKIPGDDLMVTNMNMDFSYAQAFSQEAPEAYEYLLAGCFRGDQALFARQDGVELEWEFVAPLLDGKLPLHEYEQGSEGPAAADRLVQDGRRWRPIE